MKCFCKRNGVWGGCLALRVDEAPSRRYLPSVCGDDKRVYFYGGIDEQGTILDDLWELSLETRKWSIVRFCGTCDA